MKVVLIVFGAFVLLSLVLFVSIYNKMVKNKNYMLDAWSGIDVFMKKRYDLIPILVETVKGYVTHEKATLEEITQLRAQAMQAQSSQDKITPESKLHHSLGNLFVVLENYPDLKANQSFIALQNQLAEIENDLEKSRRYYNATVRENNMYLEQFPNNILASFFTFKEGVFFQIESGEHVVPTLSL